MSKWAMSRMELLKYCFDQKKACDDEAKSYAGKDHIFWSKASSKRDAYDDIIDKLLNGNEES